MFNLYNQIFCVCGIGDRVGKKISEVCPPSKQMAHIYTVQCKSINKMPRDTGDTETWFLYTIITLYNEPGYLSPLQMYISSLHYFRGYCHHHSKIDLLHEEMGPKCNSVPKIPA